MVLYSVVCGLEQASTPANPICNWATQGKVRHSYVLRKQAVYALHEIKCSSKKANRADVLQFGGNCSERNVLFDEVVEPGTWLG